MSMAQPKQNGSDSKGTPEQKFRPFGMRDKLGYLFGDFGNDFFFILVAAFLMVLLYRCLPLESSCSRIIIHDCTFMGCLCRRNMGKIH